MRVSYFFAFIAGILLVVWGAVSLPNHVKASTTVCTWTNNSGTGDGNWGTASNWDCGQVPNNTHDVILDGTGNYPLTIDVAATVASFTVSSGYSQTITANANVTLDTAQGGSGSFVLGSGTYVAGATTLTIPGSWDMSGGSFTPGTSTVNFTATTAGKIITSGSSQFSTLTFNGAAPGAWTLQDDLTAAALTLTTGNLIDGGRQVTVNGTISIANTAGLLTSTGTWIQGATGSIGNPYSGNYFKNLTIAGSGVTTTFANHVWVGTTVGGTLTIGSGTIYGAGRVLYFYAGPEDALTVSNPTIGSALGQFWYVLTRTATQKAITLPNSFSGAVVFNNYALYNLTATGNFNLGNNTVQFYFGGTGTPTRYVDMDVYTLTAGAVTMGTAADGGYLKLGSSANHSIASLARTTGTSTTSIIDLGSGTLTVSGNVNLTGITVVPGSGTTVLTGSATLTTNGQSFHNLTVRNSTGSSQTLTVGGNLTTTGNLLIETTGIGAATLDLVTNSPTVAVSGNLSFARSSSGVPSLSFGSNTWTVGGNVNLSNGSLSAGTSTLVMSGSGTTLTPNAQTLANFQVAGSTTLAGTLTVSGNLTIDSGKSLDTSGTNYAVIVGGNWTNSGTFAANASEVTLSGTGNQTISGSTVFYRLTAGVSSGTRTLTFASGSTQTVSNALTLAGSLGNNLVLRSSSSGDQWNLTPTGSRSITYVDVQDSNNTVTANPVAASNSLNSGNTTNWSITPTALSVTAQAATGISANGAVLNGTVVDTGNTQVSERGFRLYLGSACGGSVLQTSTDTGSTYGAGSYAKTVSGLSLLTDYSYIAYVVQGSQSADSSCQSFSTINDIYYIVEGNNVWVRGSISAEKDIAQQFVMNSSNNQNINFGSSYVITSSTPNTVSDYTAGTAISGAADDATPVNTGNVTYIAANHGLLVPVVTSTGHDKTSSDIGSTWSDGTYQFVLAEISGNALTFYSKSYTSGSSWAMRTSVLGTLSHVSGATHTGSITVTSQTVSQRYPVVKNLARQILVDSSTEASGGDSGYADHLLLTEEYDLMDPSTLSLTNNPFLWNDASAVWMHVRHEYRVTPGTTVIHTTYEVQRPMNIGYLGLLQVGALTASSYDHQYYYIPKTKPTGGYDFKNIQQLDSPPASSVIFGSSNIDSSSNPPDRQVIFLKDDADSTYDLGFAFGYSPYASSAASARSASCITYGNSCWWIYTSKKTYPKMVGSVGVVNGVTYEGYAYRQWVDPSQYETDKNAYWNTVNNHSLVYIDYHKSVTDDVTTLPSSFTGQSVRVVESENIDVNETTVPSEGLSLSTTGAATYGYVVLELTHPDPTLQSTACPSQTSWCNDATPDISVSNHLAGTTYYYTVDQNASSSVDSVKAGTAVSGSSFTLPTLSSEGTWYVHVVAKNADGNYSADYATYAVKYDGSTPTGLSLTSAESGWIKTDTSTLSFSASDTLSGLDGYSLTVDSGSYASVTSPYILDLSSLEDGNHTVTVRATDAAGNYAEQSLTLNLDKTSPEVFIPTASPDTWTDGDVTISYKVTDATSGIASYRYALDEGAYSDLLDSPFTLNTIGITDGEHTFRIQAIDNAGNVRESSVPIYLRKAAPVISDGVPSGTLRSSVTQATMAVATGVAATCRYAEVSGKAYETMTSQFSGAGGTVHTTTLRNLRSGTTYTYYVRCQSERGGVSADDYMVRFSVAAKTGSSGTTTDSTSDTPSSSEATPTPSAVPTPTPQVSSDSTDNESFLTKIFTRDGQRVLEVVKIQILDANSKPVPNLSVTLRSTPQTAITNENGVATFRDVTVGKHTLTFSLNGETFRKRIDISDPQVDEETYEATIFQVWAVQDSPYYWKWFLLGGGGLLITSFLIYGIVLKFPRLILRFN